MLQDYIEHLRQSMLDRNLSKVSESIGVHYQTLRRFMSGKEMSVKNLIKIEQYINAGSDNNV